MMPVAQSQLPPSMPSMASLMPGVPPPATDVPNQNQNWVQNLAALFQARNTTQTDPMLNPGPKDLTEAMQIIDQQKKIIDGLKTQIDGGSSKRDMGGSTT